MPDPAPKTPGRTTPQPANPLRPNDAAGATSPALLRTMGLFSLVVYGVDVQPEAFGAAMQQTVDGAVAGLKAHIEG